MCDVVYRKITVIAKTLPTSFYVLGNIDVIEAMHISRVAKMLNQQCKFFKSLESFYTDPATNQISTSGCQIAKNRLLSTSFKPFKTLVIIMTSYKKSLLLGFGIKNKQ